MTAVPTPLLSLTEEQFDERYAPIAAADGNSIWEHKDTLHYPRGNVWSVVEAEDDLFVIPGYHVVNVIGYNVTALPWEHDNIEVTLWNPHDDHKSNCKDGSEDCVI